jgi:hypothetical protein
MGRAAAAARTGGQFSGVAAQAEPHQVFTFCVVPSVADPGCLSRILIFTHPGSRSRIPKQQQKEGRKKNCCNSYLFLSSSHKFHKIENYFCFEMLK